MRPTVTRGARGPRLPDGRRRRGRLCRSSCCDKTFSVNPGGGPTEMANPNKAHHQGRSPPENFKGPPGSLEGAPMEQLFLQCRLSLLTCGDVNRVAYFYGYFAWWVSAGPRRRHGWPAGDENAPAARQPGGQRGERKDGHADQDSLRRRSPRDRWLRFSSVRSAAGGCKVSY
jgi:hypothetical protein